MTWLLKELPGSRLISIYIFMRSSFSPRLVNGPLFDPVLYVRIMNEKRSLMFDCGRFQALADRELLVLDAICISHSHMNHFMGFDTVLRTILHREKPLSIFGPEGIIEKVSSKLQAYTWNLSSDYALEIIIHEILPKGMKVARARADTGFILHSEEVQPRTGTIAAGSPRYRLDAIILDHGGIPCLGYVLKEPFHINIRKGILAKNGYIAGPWLGRLKGCIFTGNLDESVSVKTSSGIKEIPAGELKAELVVVTKGQSVAYITDIAFTERNIRALHTLDKGPDSLFIETFYLDELRSVALEKGHLTASQAGMIAASLKAKQVFPMHVSPRYHERIDEITAELVIGRRDNPGPSYPY